MEVLFGDSWCSFPVSTIRTVAYVLWPQGAKKQRAQGSSQRYGGVAGVSFPSPRLLELLPVDEPVDNFMGWQMAQRLVAAGSCWLSSGVDSDQV